MLEILIPDQEYWDESKREFINIKGVTLQLEHSLISLSKWESKWKKAFLAKNDKTPEQTLDYIRCMTLNRNVNPAVYAALTQSDIAAITEYINDPMTATTINDYGKKKASAVRGDVVTSELVYYWMIQFQVPVEFERWHINRLLTLIRVCEIKAGGGKKMSKREIMSRNAALNAQRRAKLHSKG